MPADLSIDSFPATDFGVLEGEVKSIARMRYAKPTRQPSHYRYPANPTPGTAVETQGRTNVAFASRNEPWLQH